MSISSPRILDVVRAARNGKWNIPGFQRGFVWKRPQILLLLDSLYQGYPFGTILVWEVPEAEDAIAGRSTALVGPTTWVIDGQQRTTALCMLTRIKPYWWEDNSDWDDRVENLQPMIFLDPRHDVEFQLENPIRRRDPFWMRVAGLLAELAQVEYEEFEAALDREASRLATETVKIMQYGEDIDAFVHARDEIKNRLVRLGRVLVQQVPCQSVNLGPISVAEVFERVNRAGTRVRETDVTVAWLEAHNPGWVRAVFLPFCEELDDRGWTLPPSLLVPVLVALAGENPDLRNIAPGFWTDRQTLDRAWGRLKSGIEAVRQHLQALGVPTRLLPSHSALFPVIVAAAERDHVDRTLLGRMFLAATASGRYGGSTGTKFREDARRIREAGDFREAVDSYVDALSPRTSGGTEAGDPLSKWAITPAQLRASYSGAGNRYLRLLYFMTVFPKDLRAWFGSNKGLSFSRDAQGVLDPDLELEWHHFFPREFLKKNGVEDERVNWFGNIVTLDAKANRSISSKAPVQYLKMESVHAPDEELVKQCIPTDARLHEFDRFDDFLARRHELLADSMNKGLKEFGLVE